MKNQSIKTTMRVAVLDLGTNIFNLLVAEAIGKKLKVIHNSRLAVKLGQKGIGKNIIVQDAYDRGIKALLQHKQTIELYNPETTLAYGTSALRSASNSGNFIQEAYEKTGIKIQIISGEREAELISKGVLFSLGHSDHTVLILDIGGGSNEFIIAKQKEILWKQSYPIGMARLIEHFTISNPITPAEIDALENYFESQLSSLFDAVNTFKPDIFVGAEGAFESFFNLLQLESSNKLQYADLPIEKFHSLHKKLLLTTTEERTKMKDLEPYRVEMIVPASIFVSFVLDKLNLKKMIVSFYSLKEGAAIEFFNID
jgi:exopolyphosphatase / guanosine-5'-triphosphate,3'-diphosphate pyrophosphatase